MRDAEVVAQREQAQANHAARVGDRLG